jgi:UDP:flavonoid glycosyltransferase YjiC (YdhE family)
MSTVALIVDSTMASHIYSSIGVARRLQRRGFEVEYWGIARNGSDRLIDSQGFRFHPLDGLWSRYEEEIRLPTDLNVFNVWFRGRALLSLAIARRAQARRLCHVLDQLEASLNRRIAQARPAFAIIDPFLLAYYPLLKQRGITTVVLSTKPLPVKDPAVPPYDSSLMPRESVISRMCIAGAWQLRQLQDIRYRTVRVAARLAGLHTYHSILKETARRTGFPLRREIVRRWLQPDLHFRSVQEWALWTPETDLPRERRLPANIRYIGPSVDLERRQRELPLACEPGRRLIYVAVGTARFRWKDNVPFLRKVITAFSEVAGVLVVISTGDERATKILGTPPAHIRLFDFLPQLEVLKIASLVITHAGAGTYRESIERCVPLLAYPRNHDQCGNAARIEYHGIGLRGRRKTDTPEVIRSKALRILDDPRFRERLAALRATVSRREEALLSDALNAIKAEPQSPSIETPRPTGHVVTAS